MFDATLPGSFGSCKVDCYKYHGLGHNNLLLFQPYRAAWKNYDVVYLDYAVLQSHNWKIKKVVDTHTNRVDSSVHAVVHKTVHEKLHKVFHGMSLLTQKFPH